MGYYIYIWVSRRVTVPLGFRFFPQGRPAGVGFRVDGPKPFRV